jgi:hypothetical protein
VDCFLDKIAVERLIQRGVIGFSEASHFKFEPDVLGPPESNGPGSFWQYLSNGLTF